MSGSSQVPNYSVESELFDELFPHGNIFLGPQKRYVYRSPLELRPQLGNKQRKYVAPYVTLWALLAFPHLEMPSELNGLVVARCRSELPSTLRGSPKGSDEALRRKAFNAFCRSHGLGKLCFVWAQKGRCSCSHFEHPREDAALKAKGQKPFKKSAAPGAKAFEALRKERLGRREKSFRRSAEAQL